MESFAVHKDPLEEAYALMADLGFPPPEGEEREAVPRAALEALAGHPHAGALATACQAYYMFRRLHRPGGERLGHRTLLGDFFYSIFAKELVALDDDWLAEQFAHRLESECEAAVREKRAPNLADCVAFVRETCRGYAV